MSLNNTSGASWSLFASRGIITPSPPWTRDENGDENKRGHETHPMIFYSPSPHQLRVSPDTLSLASDLLLSLVYAAAVCFIASCLKASINLCLSLCVSLSCYLDSQPYGTVLLIYKQRPAIWSNQKNLTAIHKQTHYNHFSNHCRPVY